MTGLSSGQILNERFTLIRPLRRGGRAEVWLLRDDVLGEQIVAKILPADAGEDEIALLHRECRTARRLVHPNIARVIDVRESEGHHFITMNWIEGGDLRVLRGAEPEKILRVLLSVADALAYAHGQGVVHRDLKASNVLLDESGQPWLLDFGIAAVSADDEPLELSGGGTQANASPQQRAGDEPSPSDDIYSFGVLLDSLIGRARPSELSALVASLLADFPSDRPADMATVKRRLAEILEDQPDSTRPAAPKPEASVRLTPPPRVPPIQPISPRATAAAPKKPQRRGRLGTVLLALAFVAFIIFDIVVLFPWLKQRSEKGGEEDVVVAEELREPEEGTVAADPVVASATARFRRQAEDSLGHVVELLDLLDGKAVRLWADTEYRAVESVVAQGDGLLTAGNYLEARDTYSDALRRLEGLEHRAGEVLQQALVRGAQALDQEDSAAAQAAFELALGIAPGNSTASAGVKRAAVLDEVVALLRSGARDERSGRMEAAARAYNEALRLDPLSTSARDALALVRGRLEQDAFAGAMSDGLVALGDGDYDGARAAFERAERLRPGSAEVADGLAQVEQSKKLEAIATHRGRAGGLEAGEQWSAAAEQFKAVLELDPTIRFAQSGLDRCLERAGLEERLVFHINHSDRLNSDAVYSEALELFNEGSEVQPAGPKHREQLARLDAMLEAAGKRVTIWLESDNQTEVTIYKVGKLGTFTRRELALRPGTYTVVGTRVGYRDVRQRIVVELGREHQPLIVRCEEKV
jgi:serine/threonine protein kinase